LTRHQERSNHLGFVAIQIVNAPKGCQSEKKRLRKDAAKSISKIQEGQKNPPALALSLS
jgi:hypothetical protein